MTKRVCRDCPIPNCGAKYLVRLSNHLTDVTEHLNPWSRILDEAQERHEVQLDALVEEYKRNGDSENVAHLKLKSRTLSFLFTEKNWEKYF